jgi:2-aminoadipate transaminase
MRLNFSGVGVDDIREGLKRLGEIVREQVELYGTLTGTASARSSSRRDPAPAPPAEPAPVLQLRRKRA